MKRFSFALIGSALLLLAGVFALPKASTPHIVSEPANVRIQRCPDFATVGNPRVIMETLDPSLEPFAQMWQREIGRRFTNAVGILVHGGDFVEDQWIVGTAYASFRHVTPIATIVNHFQERYPGRTIVLLACNTGHLSLNIPGVYYAKSSVWCIPDRELTPEMFVSARTLNDPADRWALVEGDTSRWQLESDIVGNIFEFVADSRRQ